MTKLLKIIITLFLVLNTLLSAKELDKVSLQLLWLDQFQFAGYYIAKEKGFYKDVGLDVELKKFTSKINVVEEVTSKKATYGISRSDILIKKSNGANIKLLSAIFQSSPFVILSTKDSNINTLSDFNDKKIMTTGDNLMDISLQSMLYKSNIDPNNLIQQKHSFDIEDLITKKTDLMASYISNEPFILKKKNIEYNIFDPKDYGFDFYSDLLFTSDNEASNNKQRTIDFKNASIKGWEYAFNNIDETVNLILKKYNIQKKSKEALIFEANELKKLAYYKLEKSHKIGYINQYKLQRIYDIYNLMGLTKKKIYVKDFIFSHNKSTLNLTKEEKKYLKQNPVIKAHNETHWAPFNFNKDGIAQGFSIDYMKLLATKIDTKVEFISGYSWSEYIKMLQTSKLDIMINIAHTKQRAQDISFTQPYYKVQNIIYVNKNNSNFNSLDDLEGTTIASVEDFFIPQELLKDRPNIKQILVKNQLETFKLLALGKVDAVIAEKAIADYFIQNNGITSIVSTSFINKKKYIANLRIGTSKDNTILRDILDKAQQTVTIEEINKLKKKWFGIEKTDNSFTEIEKLYLKNNKLLKVCTNPNWIPIEFNENDIPNGISIDTLNIIKKNLNIDIEYIKTKSWSQSQEFLKNKKCDILPSAIKTKKRELYANFTNPYLHYDLAIITKNDKSVVPNIESIIDKTMSRKKGSGLITKLKAKYPKIDILETKGYEDAFKKVANGEVYFTIATLPVLAYYKNKFSLNNLQIAGYTKMKYKLSIAVRKDDRVLLDILNKSLTSIDASTYNIIFEKWTKKQVEFKTDYKIIWYISVVFIVIISIIIFFLVRQRKLTNTVAYLNTNLEDKIEEATKELQEKNEYMLSLLGSTMEAIVIFDENYNIIQCNQAALDIFQFENMEELNGYSVFYFIPEDEKEKVIEKLSLSSVLSYEINIYRKDKSIFPALIKGSNTVIKNKKHRITTIMDLTDIKKKDQQLLQQSRLAQMGEMISMIAHQWRQPLAAISATSTSMNIKAKLSKIDNETIIELTDNISEYTQHLSDTIDDFRNFFKMNKKKEETTCNKLIKDTLSIIEVAMKSKKIKLIVNPKGNTPIKTFDNEVKQVILNLVKNAEDILIEKDIVDPTIIVTALDNCIYISDNGGGVPDKIIDKIFDPYFSTKLKKDGTGLGLYMSKMIIEDHCSGELSVTNDDNGAIFKIILGDDDENIL